MNTKSGYRKKVIFVLTWTVKLCFSLKTSYIYFIQRSWVCKLFYKQREYIIKYSDYFTQKCLAVVTLEVCLPFTTYACHTCSVFTKREEQRGGAGNAVQTIPRGEEPCFSAMVPADSQKHEIAGTLGSLGWRNSTNLHGETWGNLVKVTLYPFYIIQLKNLVFFAF